jgi:cysteine-rich repeat protein
MVKMGFLRTTPCEDTHVVRTYNGRKIMKGDKRENKKGLSTIVATLLIILLVLVAVGIVWVVVKNVLQQNSEKIMLGRVTVDLEISKADVINFTHIGVIVKRNVGRGEISGIVFIAYNTDESEAVRRNVSLQELEEQDFRIVLSVVNASHIKKVAIAPIFMTKSGKEFFGDIEDEWIFPEEIALPVCGDGIVHYTEDCDDSDTTSGDGCSVTCTIESGWDCSGEPSVCGLEPVCGDETREGSEGCDDGDTTPGDGCSATCTVESGWTCNTATPNVCTPSGGSTNYIWTGELLLNSGFESGNIENWYTNGAYFETTNNPQAGSYAVWYNHPSNVNYYIQQDVDLSAWAGYINTGDAVINATGYGRSLEYPNHDTTRIQIFFLNSGKGIIGVAARDTGYISNGAWWKDGVTEYAIPTGTSYLRVWGNTYDLDGSTSGSLDSFSVMLGYEL